MIQQKKKLSIKATTEDAPQSHRGIVRIWSATRTSTVNFWGVPGERGPKHMWQPAGPVLSTVEYTLDPVLVMRKTSVVAGKKFSLQLKTIIMLCKMIKSLRNDVWYTRH